MFQDEVGLLEIPTDNRHGIETHPVLNQRGIDAPKIGRRHKVALIKVGWTRGRVLAILPTFDTLTDGKTYPTGTMVRTSAVIVNPTSEFREQEHDDVVRRTMGLQVVKEITNRRGHLGPETGVSTDLVSMCIETTVVQVENPRAEVGKVDLCNAFQLAPNA
jgi:hypothetical protein